MTATPALTVVDGGDPSITADTPTVEVTLPVERRHRGGFIRETHTFTAYARAEGGSLMRILGGQNGRDQMLGLQTFLVRRLVDDDGVPHEAMPRLAASDDLVWPGDDQGDDDTASEPAVIPGDAALAKLRKSELVALAETHDVSPDGTNSELVKALAVKRDSTEVAVVDAEPVDDGQEWRFVWPDEATGAPGFEVVLDKDGEDFGEFASLNELQVFARSHGSSLRRFTILMDEVMGTTDTEDLDKMAQQIIEGAAGRPTRRSGPSRRSRSGKARSRR